MTDVDPDFVDTHGWHPHQDDHWDEAMSDSLNGVLSVVVDMGAGSATLTPMDAEDNILLIMSICHVGDLAVAVKVDPDTGQTLWASKPWPE
jgi:hypothetical protein